MGLEAGERFLDKVWIVESGCWLWTGAVTSAGYANFIGEDRRNVTGHLWSFDRFTDLQRDGKVVDHKCRVRSCVNPDHLRAVSHSENASHRAGVAGSRSGRRNVHWSVAAKKWVVIVKKAGKQHYGGVFDDIEDASVAASELRESLFGDFAGVA